MTTAAANVVEAILTAILQWRVAWLDEQKLNAQPPPICRSQVKKLKITYDDYKDYESTFVPLLMHEIWAQIFDEWTRLETELKGVIPMDIDDDSPTTDAMNTSILASTNYGAPMRSKSCAQQRQFNVGITDIRKEGEYQLILRCQYIIESRRASSHMKVIGEGDLIRLDVATNIEESHFKGNQSDYVVDVEKGLAIIGLFGYVNDVQSERITRHSKLASCFGNPELYRDHNTINYNVIIAKRPLRLKLNEPMRMSAIYYLKPMIRQIESVAMLKESCLASDILNPKVITCQLSVPTVVSMKSPYYNDAQYRAIIGTNEALNRPRNIPKIQLIQGPPGTGKTHTLIGIIKHYYTSDSLRGAVVLPKILICAPSNGAIDEVAKRLYKERDFAKKGPLKRSLRLLRVGHPDQISDSTKCISLDELVEINFKANIENTKKKHANQMKELEDELSRCDTEITNLRYTNRQKDIPEVEAKIARLLRDLERAKTSEALHTRREGGEASRSSLRYNLVRNADIILTTLNSCQRHPLDIIFRKDDRSEVSFHCCIVDEASQCVEPELLMPLRYRISKMILIGDPMQLPATVISRHAQDFEFGRSLFERFFVHFGRYDPTSPISMLTEQYRMHPEICRFPSKQFYDNRLITPLRPSQTYPFKPYILFEIRHGTQKASKTSLENEVEANLIKNLLQAVVMKAPEGSEIGVITPYKGQRRLLTNRISSLQTQRSIKVDVNTCDGFQGQEKDIIILSCVRTFETSKSVGFLKSFQRVNVALTRAKHCLIVCLSGKSLTKDKTWQSLMRDAIDRNVIQTLLQTPGIDKFVKMIAVDKNNTLQPVNNTCVNNTREYVPEYIMPMDID